MVVEDNNLLVNLHRWASKQDENFTTEDFCLFIELFADYEI